MFKLRNNHVTCDQFEMLQEQTNFFETLYKSQNSQDNVPESHLFNVENIDPLQILCEGMISEEECLTALKEFKNNKTPGTDGFSAEFYKFFWSDLGTVMTASFNYAKRFTIYQPKARNYFTHLQKEQRQNFT